MAKGKKNKKAAKHHPVPVTTPGNPSFDRSIKGPKNKKYKYDKYSEQVQFEIRYTVAVADLVDNGLEEALDLLNQYGTAKLVSAQVVKGS